MKTCWKRALKELNALGILPDMPTSCGICEQPLRYSDDVTLKKILFVQEGMIGVTLVHLICATIDPRKAATNH